ncbi:HD-GYP domain-containing protein [Paenibacillus rigui]|uniref:HD family phosphohydrolase n=1 Tax=Paenibacillus rigui TaxID=554312 RepID=A0A229UM75_9BACL|nr:HD-GYP domain-containing protein [Paenibacillus rigui]OXM84510.1 HD family phosphohydrolase [Paenibacillus rigui]
MAMVLVSQLKPGEKLIEHVQTKRGNLLLPKGKIITEKEIEILKAFLIPAIAIESKTTDQQVKDAVAEETVSVSKSNPFYDEYDKMLALLRKLFTSVSGENPQIFEIRTQLETLLQHIDQYHILTFTPKMFQLTDYIYHNSIMVSLTSYCLAKWHGLPSKDWIPVALGGLLHDIGNAKVDSHILFKPDSLTKEEVEEMKKHTIIGYNFLKNVKAISEGVKLTALQHHEREDGSGYPLGVKGENIHLYSKIVAITDMFHAMTSDRYHKKASSRYIVLDQLFTESFGKLDPSLVQTFIQKVTQFHNGVLVKLSDNRIGEIVFSDRTHPTRPWVNVNGDIINLTTERSLYIQDVIRK